MKTKLKTMTCVLAVSLGCVSPTFASPDNDPFNMVVDTVLVRPVCLVATAIGATFFVVTLPIAAISRSVKSSAHALVVKPAQATFTRPLGDMDALMD